MPDQNHISYTNRRNIIDSLLSLGCIKGDMDYSDFAKYVYPQLSESLYSDISRHMDCFSDYSESQLLISIIDTLHMSDNEFLNFIKSYVSPTIHRKNWNESEQQFEPLLNTEIVDCINNYLVNEGYQLVEDHVLNSDHYYKLISLNRGVQGELKNIIFATRIKPRILFDDVLNNTIRVENGFEECLFYDLPISNEGITWSALENWYNDDFDRLLSDYTFQERLRCALFGENFTIHHCFGSWYEHRSGLKSILKKFVYGNSITAFMVDQVLRRRKLKRLPFYRNLDN